MRYDPAVPGKRLSTVGHSCTGLGVPVTILRLESAAQRKCRLKMSLTSERVLTELSGHEVQ